MKVLGPYVRKDGRKHVVIVKNDGSKTTKSYARYLMEQHLGRFLGPHETVDHVDNDRTNDSITNLQILSLADNIRKAALLKPRQIYKFVCPVCKSESEKFMNQVKGNLKKGKAGPFCSRKCAGLYSTRKL